MGEILTKQGIKNKLSDDLKDKWEKIKEKISDKDDLEKFEENLIEYAMNPTKSDRKQALDSYIDISLGGSFDVKRALSDILKGLGVKTKEGEKTEKNSISISEEFKRREEYKKFGLKYYGDIIEDLNKKFKKIDRIGDIDAFLENKEKLSENENKINKASNELDKLIEILKEEKEKISSQNENEKNDFINGLERGTNIHSLYEKMKNDELDINKLKELKEKLEEELEEELDKIKNKDNKKTIEEIINEVDLSIKLKLSEEIKQQFSTLEDKNGEYSDKIYDDPSKKDEKRRKKFLKKAEKKAKGVLNSSISEVLEDGEQGSRELNNKIKNVLSIGDLESIKNKNARYIKKQTAERN